MSRFWRISRAAIAVASALLCAALVMCYVLRPDRCAAVTVLPIWYWPPFAAASVALSWQGRGRLVLLPWVAFFLIFAEEPRSLARGLLPVRRAGAKTARGETLRLVTLNCAGEIESAEHVVPLHPDVVVLQECPPMKEMAQLAHRLYGEQGRVLLNADSAIVYGGPLRREAAPLRYSAQARLTLPSGREMTLVSVHLIPNRADLSLWSRETWAAQTRNRQRRREQMTELARGLAAAPRRRPLVLAGDFNIPAGDAVFRVLPDRLHDAFPRAGRGWGNTWMATLPLVRIDQVWISDEWRPLSVTAQAAPPSDHRMVVCELALSP
jgi:endonuclease/exonuclease/phosphatase (EEP) superfamily protein YafD